MKKINITLLFVAILSISFSSSSYGADSLPKYGKWCGNTDSKLRVKAIDKTDKACKRNFKCRAKAKTGLEKLKCDTKLISYLQKKKSSNKSKEGKEAVAKILSYFEQKAINW
jgi:hypothetical protein